MSGGKFTAGKAARFRSLIAECVEALKAARAVISSDLDCEIHSNAIGSWDGKSKYTLSLEGKHYVKPYRRALKKIDAAIARASGDAT